jgi:hypothetical protein
MATGATEFIDNTTADAFLAEIWSQEAIVAREAVLLFASQVNRVFEKDVAKFGDTIHVPSVGNLAVATKSTNTAIVYETITEANTDITISTHEYQAIAIETITKRQVNRDLLSVYAPKQGYALGLSIDDVLAGLVDDFTQTTGTLGAELAYEDVLRGDQYLNDANVPMSGRVINVSPAQKAGFMKLDQFIHADYSKLNADANAAMQESYLGTWMKYPVHCSTNVEGTNAAGHDNAMFQKEALALVVQMKPTTHTFFDIDYLADKVAIEQLHGSKEMRDDHGVWLKGA